MQMQRIGAFVVAVILGVAQSAAADHLVAARLELSPSGHLESHDSSGIGGGEAPTDDGWGFGLTIGRVVTPNVIAAVAPRVTFDLADSGRDGGLHQLDIMGRVMPIHRLHSGVVLHGYAALGYSRLFVPQAPVGEQLKPAGLAVGFGAGCQVPATPQLLLGLEAGYQLGWQGGTYAGGDYTYSSDLLHVGLSIGAEM